MKKILLCSLSFLLIHMVLRSQDYRNIITSGTAFYSGTTNQAGFLSGVSSDSLLSQGNGDTLFLAVNTIRPMTPAGPLLDTVGGILGRKIFKLHTGWFWFFNAAGDTIFLNSGVALNDSWKVFSLPQKGEIRATCTSIQLMTLLGTSDTVKEFTFQARDSNGVNISNYYNGKTIRLSRQYGFVQVYDLYRFPETTGLFQLEGRNNPVIGFQGLTWHDVYDYDMGDVFHIVTHENYQLTSQLYTIDHKYIRTVTSKQVAPGGETVTYTFEYCDEERSFNFATGYGTSYHTGTVQETYPYTNTPASESGTFVPDPFNRNGNRYFSTLYNIIPGVPSCGQNPNYYLCCWKPNPNYNLYANEQEYARGLGKVHDKQWMYYNWEVYYNYEDLVYYKKGTQQWGSPLYADCEHMIPVLSASPNPIVLDYQAGSFDTLNISTNQSWTITNPSGSTGFEYSPASGQGNMAVLITAKYTNTSSYPISENININYAGFIKQVTIRQQPDTVLHISSSPDTLVLGWDLYAKDTLVIKSNSTWNLTCKEEWPVWANNTGTSGSGDGNIVFVSISQNPGSAIRSVPLTLESPAGNKDILLIQQSKYGLGVGHKQNASLKVLPNPILKTAVIAVTGLPENLEKKLSLYDIAGRPVFTDYFYSEAYLFNRQALSPGIYFLKVGYRDDQPPAVVKVVIE
jgi:hypothetical protein